MTSPIHQSLTSNDGFQAPILPSSFRMFCVIGRRLGSSVDSIRIANSRKQLIHFIDLNVKNNTDYKHINNPCFPAFELSAAHINFMLTFAKAPQLLIIDSMMLHINNIPEIIFLMHKLFERSCNNGNYEYPINIIMRGQDPSSVSPEFRKYFNITILGKTNNGKNNAKLVPSINKQDFANINDSLHNYDRVQVNNVQMAVIIHKNNATHIPAKL